MLTARTSPVAEDTHEAGAAPVAELDPVRLCADLSRCLSVVRAVNDQAVQTDILSAMKKARCVGTFVFGLAVCVGFGSVQQEQAELAVQPAHNPPDWLKSGVIYQVFVRSFSPEGKLVGVTTQLDRLHDLGVNILWLMPIHPVGQAKKKGSLGSA